MDCSDFSHTFQMLNPVGHEGGSDLSESLRATVEAGQVQVQLQITVVTQRFHQP